MAEPEADRRYVDEADVLPNAPSAVVRVSAFLCGTRAGYVRQFHQCCRDLVPDRAVGAFLVVVSTPSLHLFRGVGKTHEPMAVQAISLKRPSNASINSVVGWLSRP